MSNIFMFGFLVFDVIINVNLNSFIFLIKHVDMVHGIHKMLHIIIPIKKANKPTYVRNIKHIFTSRPLSEQFVCVH